MRFRKLFKKKPVIGMIHLAGLKRDERVFRGLAELELYQEEGVAGVIIEDYHGDAHDVYNLLMKTEKRGLKIVRGVNVLRNPYSAFELADEFGAGFIQFDSVQANSLDSRLYQELRRRFPEIVVLGGVEFKYTQPSGNPLEIDLENASKICDAVVTTGMGTGIETPTEKLRQYKKLLGDFPLIVGAGTNPRNIYEQLSICDGAIVGSYLKPGRDTTLPVDRILVREFMTEARKAIEEGYDSN